MDYLLLSAKLLNQSRLKNDANTPSFIFGVELEADKAEPEARNDQLAHFYHRKLGDILLEVGEPAMAAEHFKIVIEKQWDVCRANSGPKEGPERRLSSKNAGKAFSPDLNAANHRFGTSFPVPRSR